MRRTTLFIALIVGGIALTSGLWFARLRPHRPGRNTSYVATPVLHERRLTWIDDRGMFYVANADTGELIKRARVPGIESGERPVYASPIVVANRIFAQTRNRGLFISTCDLITQSMA